MASRSKSSRSRKRRNPDGAPRAVASSRRQLRAERRERTELAQEHGQRPRRREGERPEGMFGGLPVSEVAILVGLIAAVVGFAEGGGAPLIVGLIVCALGVVEVTAREHFSGYRSHTLLLAAIPAIAVEVGVVLAFGEPGQRLLLLVVIVPVFAVLFWLLRRRFAVARQARVARRPAPRT